MTKQEMFGLLAIERACVSRASGMEAFFELDKDRKAIKAVYRKVNKECDRDCANCSLVQKSEDLLQMYDAMLQKLGDEIREEEEQVNNDWRDWQLDCDPRQPLAI